MNFVAQQPQGQQASVLRNPQGDGKMSILDLALGVGGGLITGNWAPLANSILPGAGAFFGGAGGDKKKEDPSDPEEGGGTEDTGEDPSTQPNEQPGLAADDMLPPLGMPAWVGGQAVPQPPPMAAPPPMAQMQGNYGAPMQGYGQMPMGYPPQQQPSPFFRPPGMWGGFA